jgi:hypothetical protein
VLVDQPTVEDTISILRGLRERFEVHHGVRILDSALVNAATLSHRYISDRFLAGQGHRSGRRSGGHDSNRDGLDAAGTGRPQPAGPAARNRGDRPRQGKGRAFAPAS